jgi:tripartite motif-containing protein 71
VGGINAMDFKVTVTAKVVGLFLGLVFALLISSSLTYIPAAGGPQGNGLNNYYYTFLTKWGSFGTGNTQFRNIGDIGIDAFGHIYVVDRGNDRIEKFDTDGRFITLWGSAGIANGQFNHEVDIAVYPCGNNLYIADKDNNRVQMFGTDGKFIRKWGSAGIANGQFNNPEGIGIDSRQGNVYVADTDNRVQMFHDNGTFVTAWGSFGTANGQFNHPTRHCS